jgi:hypothetical protein
MRKFLKAQEYGQVIRLAHNFGLKIRTERGKTIDLVVKYCKTHKIGKKDLLIYDPTMKDR